MGPGPDISLRGTGYRRSKLSGKMLTIAGMLYLCFADARLCLLARGRQFMSSYYLVSVFKTRSRAKGGYDGIGNVARTECPWVMGGAYTASKRLLSIEVQIPAIKWT